MNAYVDVNIQMTRKKYTDDKKKYTDDKKKYTDDKNKNKNKLLEGFKIYCIMVET